MSIYFYGKTACHLNFQLISECQWWDNLAYFIFLNFSTFKLFLLTLCIPCSFFLWESLSVRVTAHINVRMMNRGDCLENYFSLRQIFIRLSAYLTPLLSLFPKVICGKFCVSLTWFIRVTHRSSFMRCCLHGWSLKGLWNDCAAHVTTRPSFRKAGAGFHSLFLGGFLSFHLSLI